METIGGRALPSARAISACVAFGRVRGTHRTWGCYGYTRAQGIVGPPGTLRLPVQWQLFPWSTASHAAATTTALVAAPLPPAPKAPPSQWAPGPTMTPHPPSRGHLVFHQGRGVGVHRQVPLWAGDVEGEVLPGRRHDLRLSPHLEGRDRSLCKPGAVSGPGDGLAWAHGRALDLPVHTSGSTCKREGMAYSKGIALCGAGACGGHEGSTWSPQLRRFWGPSFAQSIHRLS